MSTAVIAVAATEAHYVVYPVGVVSAIVTAGAPYVIAIGANTFALGEIYAANPRPAASKPGLGGKPDGHQLLRQCFCRRRARS
jgi:hypothetical protein